MLVVGGGVDVVEVVEVVEEVTVIYPQGWSDSRSGATYKLRVDAPPQISLELPVQGISKTVSICDLRQETSQVIRYLLQEDADNGTEPLPSTTLQKHCVAYSTPAKAKPLSLQAKRHSSTAIVEVFRFCWYSKARPPTPSE